MTELIDYHIGLARKILWETGSPSSNGIVCQKGLYRYNMNCKQNGNHCSSWSKGVIWAYQGMLNTAHASAFWIIWSFLIFKDRVYRSCCSNQAVDMSMTRVTIWRVTCLNKGTNWCTKWSCAKVFLATVAICSSSRSCLVQEDPQITHQSLMEKCSPIQSQKLYILQSLWLNILRHSILVALNWRWFLPVQ